jgi:hypothetical protein
MGFAATFPDPLLESVASMDAMAGIQNRPIAFDLIPHKRGDINLASLMVEPAGQVELIKITSIDWVGN